MTADPSAVAYPLFRRPDAYHRKRCASSLRNRMQRWWESRALRALLREADGARSLCDLPCGIGRSFSLWAEAGLTVLGVELSAPMAARAELELARLGVPGRVEIGDAFVPRQPPTCADLVVCLRFAYYFESEHRRRLLAALHSRSRRFLLIQYRIGDGLLGRWKVAQAERRLRRRQTHGKHFARWHEIQPELESAGWSVRQMRRQSPLSDRVLIFAERSAPKE
jgi:hypothetical protein